jgi:uncharacterized protein
MQCPVCDERMKEVERQGVSIDICPGCKGVWLDRGELEKLIAASQGVDLGGGPVPGAVPHDRSGFGFLGRDDHGRGHERHDDDHDKHREHDRDHDRGRYPYSEHDRGHGQYGQQRRGSWLSDIFGGDD